MKKKDEVITIQMEMSVPVVALLGSMINYCLMNKEDYLKHSIDKEEQLAVMEYLMEQFGQILAKSYVNNGQKKVVN